MSRIPRPGTSSPGHLESVITISAGEHVQLIIIDNLNVKV